MVLQWRFKAVIMLKYTVYALRVQARGQKGACFPAGRPAETGDAAAATG